MMANENSFRVIARIAQVSRMIGMQAGVGGMETAGSIVSYLARHPDQIDAFVEGDVSPVDWPSRWLVDGCLSWHAKNGDVVFPHSIRFDTTPCGLGVGCDEAGVCYAAAHDQPWRCGRDTDGSPEGRDAQRLDGEAATAGSDK